MKTFFSRISTLAIVLLASTFSTYAQNPMNILNDQLRLMFSNTANPNVNVHFLYDMSSHLVDSVYFNSYVTDTSNVNNWHMLYREMYYAAYDTSILTPSEQVAANAWAYIQKDTIPVGLMDWDYNLLKSDALTTNDYYDFDTVNQLLYDKNSRASSPYTFQTVFAGAPLTDMVSYTNPVFKVDPQFIFKDAGKIYDGYRADFRINFHDGTGWHSFDPTVTTYYQANYPDSGSYPMEFAIFNYQNQIVKYSVSTFRTTGAEPIVSPDDLWTDISGIEVGVYNGCTANADTKYVVYLEGMDMLNNRNVGQIYNGMIHIPAMSELRNYGYTFLVVNWNNPYKDMKDNAMSVVELLNRLKGLAHTNNDPPPVVVIGESMGGLIGRYALCYMESPAYTGNSNNPMSALMHNTRLFMTFDSPNQGANIPLGYQWFYRYLLPFTMLQASSILNVMQNYQLGLDGTSTKQMLLYHVETEQFPAPITTSTYDASSLKKQFDDDLKNLGNYPQYCKLVATSNGSWQGTPQIRWYDSTDRQPNDHMMEFNAETYLRVLGIRLLGTTQQFDIRTNPNGTGLVFKMNQGISHWKLRLRRWRISVDWWTDYLIDIEKTAKDVRAYCTGAGSYTVSSIKPFYSGIGDYAFNIFSLFQVYSSTSNGTLTYTTNGGIPWLSNANLNFSLHSDGNNFALIPVQSSFDYNLHPLDYNILQDPVGTTMAQTPFDVAVTNPSKFNRNHLHEEDPYLNYCQTCISNGGPHYSYSTLYTREIGDDSLYLENTRAKLPFRIEAERGLKVNYRNPYYNYPSTASVQPHFQFQFYADSAQQIILSKERPYEILNSAGSIFRSNSYFSINPAQPLTGPYQYQPGNMVICCVNFARMLQHPIGTAAAQQVHSALEVYPNPLEKSDLLTIKYRFAANGPVHIDIYDMLGRKQASYQPFFADNTHDCYYPVHLALPSGIYLVSVTNGKEKQTVRVSIIE